MDMKLPCVQNDFTDNISGKGNLQRMFFQQFVKSFNGGVHTLLTALVLLVACLPIQLMYASRIHVTLCDQSLFCP